VCVSCCGACDVCKLLFCGVVCCSVTHSSELAVNPNHTSPSWVHKGVSFLCVCVVSKCNVDALRCSE